MAFQGVMDITRQGTGECLYLSCVSLNVICNGLIHSCDFSFEAFFDIFPQVGTVTHDCCHCQGSLFLNNLLEGILMCAKVQNCCLQNFKRPRRELRATIAASSCAMALSISLMTMFILSMRSSRLGITDAALNSPTKESAPGANGKIVWHWAGTLSRAVT